MSFKGTKVSWGTPTLLITVVPETEDDIPLSIPLQWRRCSLGLLLILVITEWSLGAEEKPVIWVVWSLIRDSNRGRDGCREGCCGVKMDSGQTFSTRTSEIGHKERKMAGKNRLALVYRQGESVCVCVRANSERQS